MSETKPTCITSDKAGPNLSAKTIFHDGIQNEPIEIRTHPDSCECDQCKFIDRIVSMRGAVIIPRFK